MTLGGASLGVLVGAFGVLGGALVALYLLRLERRRLEVPFAQLWQRVLGQSESVTLHRRLKRPFSLLLMLSVLLALLLAIGDLQLGAARDRRSWVLIIDASASMQARDYPNGRTRFAEAQRQALQLLGRLGGDDEAMVIRLDAQPRALGPFCPAHDLDELTADLGKMVPGEGGADLPRALALAQDALRGHAAPTLVLLSDGALGCTHTDGTGIPRAADCELTDVESGVTVTQIRPEKAHADNVALTAFSARRYRANRSAYEVLVEVQSYDEAPQKVRLDLEDDGDTVETTTLTLAPHERHQQLYAQLTGSGSHLVARLTPSGADGLALDDVAYAALPPRKKLHVLLVSDGDLFLEGALLLDENVSVERVAKAAYAATDLAPFDAVVFDGLTPPAPAAKDALYINPSPGGPFAIAGTLDNPVVTERDEHHPLARWLSWRDLNIRSASRFVLAPGDTAVASVLGKPIIVAREQAGHKSVAIGFELAASDLPLRMAFPVLVINTLEWFLGGDSSLIASFSTTERIDLAASGAEVPIRGPGGAQTLPVRDGHAQLYAERAGFYDVAGRTIAVSLTNATESNIAARAIRWHGQPLSPPSVGAARPSRALWTYLVALALLVLFAEWWSYHRRWTV